VALCAFWLAAFFAADAALLPASHCARLHMPCCPGGERCAPAQCVEQVAQKPEAQVVRADECEQPPEAAIAARPMRPAVPGGSFIRVLRTGLRFQASVFRLKDDLRV